MSKRPAPPPRLDKAGKALWRSIHNDLDRGWELMPASYTC